MGTFTRPIAFAAWILVIAPVRATPTVPLRAPPQPPAQLFAFHSSFWLNLHHFLYITARARKGLDTTRPAVTRVLDDTAGFGALPASDRQRWQLAVDYYTRMLATRDILFDSGMVVINNRLASRDSAPTLQGSGLDSSLAAVLEQAAPIYRRLWWPAHDAMNQRWASTEVQLLARYGDRLAAEESGAFRTPWSATPVRVDITAYANWAGAYTSEHPAHITVSSSDPANQEDQGLEILFHEVLHTMDNSLGSALAAEYRARGKAEPRDPTHPFIFYTAGALVAEAIPGHVPYAERNGLWNRVPDFAKARPALQQRWQPYLDGRIAFATAIQDVVAAIP